MTNHPFVSVCIPTYNQAPFLARAIESALNQADVNLKVYVADDCSSDYTSYVLEKFSKDSRVHIHRAAQNHGIAHNASLVIGLAQSDYIVRLDSDDMLKPNFCKVLSELLDANPNAAVAHCAVKEINENDLKRRTRRLARKGGFQDSESSLHESHQGYKVAANICMFRKEALAALPYIYHVGVNFGEDWDLFVRLADIGWGNVYSSSVLAEYRVWRKQDKLSVSRKEAEVYGLIHIFGNTIPTAWARRGWDCSPIDASRLRFASLHLQSIMKMNTQSCEFQSLRKALLALADNDEQFIDLTYERLSSAKVSSDSLAYFRAVLKDLAKALLYR